MNKKVRLMFLIGSAIALMGASCAAPTTKSPARVSPGNDSSVNASQDLNAGEPVAPTGSAIINVSPKPADDQTVPEILNEPGTKKDETPVLSQPPVKEFNVKMQRFSFEPSTLRVKKGDMVKINATSLDTSHGISLSEFGVFLTVPMGETKSVSFLADKQGTFSFRCSVMCGSGHSDMKGTLIVE